MIELAPRSASPIARFGGQPIAIAAAALVIVVLGSQLYRPVARLYRQRARDRSRGRDPAVAGPRRAGVRTTGREDQGPGSDAAGIDRSVAGGAGSVADRAPPARRAADRHQEAFRAGRNADGSGRGLAAILCQRASLRTLRGSLAAQAVSQGKAPRGEPQPRKARDYRRRVAKVARADSARRSRRAPADLNAVIAASAAPIGLHSAGRRDIFHR